MKDIIGETFGYLKVVKKLKRGFLCDCLNCGNNNIISDGWSLASGHKKSCGCIAKYIEQNLIGQKFGHLEVRSMVREFCPNIGKKGKFRYFAICKCHNCGNNEFKVLKASIKGGRTTSCGCSKERYEKTRGEKSVQFTGYKEISGSKWSSYKRGAIKGRKLKWRKRELDFEIEIEYAWQIYENQKGLCALSGLPIKFGKENTASLDRINSKLGYVKNNVQWLHKEINRMKMDLEQNRFIELCALVTKRNSL